MQTQDEINEDNKRAFEAARAASARAADLEVAFAALYRFVDCLPTAMQDLVKPDEWAAICRLKRRRRRGGHVKFAIVMQQRGGGCDHTIACGTKLVPLEADDRGGALAEARRYLIGEDGDRPVYQTGQDNDYDGALEHAYLVRVEDELPLDEIVAELRAVEVAAKQARDEEAERQQYDRLHRKFGRRS